MSVTATQCPLPVLEILCELNTLPQFQLVRDFLQQRAQVEAKFALANSSGDVANLARHQGRALMIDEVVDLLSRSRVILEERRGLGRRDERRPAAPPGTGWNDG